MRECTIFAGLSNLFDMEVITPSEPQITMNDTPLLYGKHAVKLPFTFDVAQLQAELAQIPAEAWKGHYNHKEYEGDWAVAPLRSVAGHPDVVYAVLGAAQAGFYQNTIYLEQSPTMRSVIEQMKSPVGCVRLMRLGPGAKILEHSDNMGSDKFREYRLHVPIVTNPDVKFMVDGQRVNMQPGELWYADFEKKHRVDNDGDTERVHLVIDCLADEALLKFINDTIEFEMIEQFLNGIGIPTAEGPIEGETFLPGVLIHNGTITYDRNIIASPGDLLHEAGHIAVSPNRTTIGGNVGASQTPSEAMGEEIATILWSYAALKAIGLSEKSVFHDLGYKGVSDWHIDMMKSGHFNGLPLLEWMGMTAAPAKAEQLGVPPFPHMLHWLRPVVVYEE
jgi:quercetin dioxygenase-like cupin family protein